MPLWEWPEHIYTLLPMACYHVLVCCEHYPCHGRTPMLIFRLFTLAVLLVLSDGFLLAYAAPYVPTDPSALLEKLPARPSDPRTAESRDLRARLARNPNDLPLALKLAQSYYDQVAEESDPRLIGYAEGVLAPWWNMPEPPVDVLVMRANIRQFRHDFDGALADLAQVAAREPRNVKAWSTSAAIHTVQARYDEARRHCEKMLGLTTALMAQGCSLSVDSMTGKSKPAYDALLAELQKAGDATPPQKLWVQTRLGEMAQRFGDVALAEKHFKAGLALGISDGYLLAAYADLLLDQKRPQEVIALLKDKTRSDILLLRLALAEQQLNSPALNQHRDELAARFDAARLRGDKLHQADESRFHLQLLKQSKAALELAQENWQLQREPRDARPLLEAALAQKKIAAAQPILDWLRISQYEEPLLSALAAQVSALKTP
jgi:hypothetical protein